MIFFKQNDSFVKTLASICFHNGGGGGGGMIGVLGFNQNNIKLQIVMKYQKHFQILINWLIILINLFEVSKSFKRVLIVRCFVAVTHRPSFPCKRSWRPNFGRWNIERKTHIVVKLSARYELGQLSLGVDPSIKNTPSFLFQFPFGLLDAQKRGKLISDWF